jgi:cytochrome P450
VIRKRSDLYNELRANQLEQVEKKRLNFLDLMLQLQSEQQMTMEQLREETDTFMFAGRLEFLGNFIFPINKFSGHDTTSHAVSWAIWALATHPEIQARLYREIVDTFGETDTEFATAKIKDLKYLDAFLKVGFWG